MNNRRNKAHEVGCENESLSTSVFGVVVVGAHLVRNESRESGK